MKQTPLLRNFLSFQVDCCSLNYFLSQCSLVERWVSGSQLGIKHDQLFILMLTLRNICMLDGNTHFFAQFSLNPFGGGHVAFYVCPLAVSQKRPALWDHPTGFGTWLQTSLRHQVVQRASLAFGGQTSQLCRGARGGHMKETWTLSRRASWTFGYHSSNHSTNCSLQD